VAKETLEGIEIKPYIKKHFSSEKEMCNFIEDNIDLFSMQILGSKLISYVREYKFFNGTRKGASVDFFIKTEIGDFFIECKNTNSFNDLCGAIGQCLCYISLGKSQGDKAKMFLITSNYHSILVQSIKDNNLDIQLVVFNKEHSLFLL